MKPIRFAVVGAGRVAGTGTGRGTSFIAGCEAMPDKVQLVAVCDIDEGTQSEWRARGDVRVYGDYQKLLEDNEVDAVCLSTPAHLHARQAIAALEAGKHVLSEVPAAYQLQDCFDLVEAVEKSGRTYMLAENYCFMRDVMMVTEMTRRGVFGDLIYAEGSYLHDCRELFFDPDGKLTWRGEFHRTMCANTYPTHSMGPICQWMDINRTDRLKTLGAWGSPSLAASRYVARNLGEDHPLARDGAWKLPNSVNVSLNTEKGVLVHHRLDWASPRPHHMNRYELQGTRAAFCSSADPHLEPLIWIADKSEQSPKGTAGNWEELWKYSDEYEHPLWREFFDQAASAGHGGGDFFVLREFASAVNEGRPPLIDVYDAVAWSSVTPLSEISLAKGGAPVEVPDFKSSQ